MSSRVTELDRVIAAHEYLGAAVVENPLGRVIDGDLVEPALKVARNLNDAIAPTSVPPAYSAAHS
jgi:hypothetical protein